MPLSTWLSTLGRRPLERVVCNFTAREHEWLRQALALAVIEYDRAMWERDQPHAERIAFLQRLLKALEVR